MRVPSRFHQVVHQVAHQAQLRYPLVRRTLGCKRKHQGAWLMEVFLTPRVRLVRSSQMQRNRIFANRDTHAQYATYRRAKKIKPTLSMVSIITRQVSMKSITWSV